MTLPALATISHSLEVAARFRDPLVTAIAAAAAIKPHVGKTNEAAASVRWTGLAVAVGALFDACVTAAATLASAFA